MFKFSSSCPSNVSTLAAAAAAVEQSGLSGSSLTSCSSRALQEDSYTSNRATREDCGSSSTVAREDSGSSSRAIREDSGSSSRIGAVKGGEAHYGMMSGRQPAAGLGVGNRVMVDAANLMLTAAAPASVFDGMMAKVRRLSGLLFCILF
jgi:hypothetical protein